MKVYQLLFGHNSYDEGYVTTPGRTYSNREAAEAAKKWLDSIPDDPYEPYPTEVHIKEVEIEDTFVPWISEERIEAKRKEVEEFFEYYAPDEDWGGDMYD